MTVCLYLEKAGPQVFVEVGQVPSLTRCRPEGFVREASPPMSLV